MDLEAQNQLLDFLTLRYTSTSTTLTEMDWANG